MQFSIHDLFRRENVHLELENVQPEFENETTIKEESQMSQFASTAAALAGSSPDTLSDFGDSDASSTDLLPCLRSALTNSVIEPNNDLSERAKHISQQLKNTLADLDKVDEIYHPSYSTPLSDTSNVYSTPLSILTEASPILPTRQSRRISQNPDFYVAY